MSQIVVYSNPGRLDLSVTAEVAGKEELTYEWSQNGQFLAGADIELLTSVSGSEPIVYEWYHNDQLVDEVAGNTLRLANAGVDASGDYHFAVTNPLGEAVSDSLPLAVLPAGTLTLVTGSVSVYEGDNIDLSVTATGLPQLTYQWSFGGAMIDGATDSTLSLNNFEADAAGDYRLAISLDDRLVGEVVISVIVPAARIVKHPVGGIADIGGSYTFEVIAIGTEPIMYQWYHRGASIEDAVGSSLQLTNLAADNAGGYRVTVSNETLPWGGEETSSNANLNFPLAITGLTDSMLLGGASNWQWAMEGETINLAVTALGTPPLVYQWSKEGVAIDGETSSRFILSDLTKADAGDYRVKVSNAVDGEEESETISVIVVTAETAVPAKIVLQPEGGSAVLGEDMTLRVGAEGTSPISYQWYYGGVLMEGETSSILVLNDIQRSTTGDYYVVVSNEEYPWGATEVSDTVILTVEAPPVITELTESMTLEPGESVELSVTAVGDEPLTYQWNKAGLAIDGATGSTLSLDAVSTSDAGDYTVAVTNAAGQVESDVVKVEVIQPVKIVTQPENASVVVGRNAMFMVVVEGTEPIEYFWMHDGKWVEDGTESTLRLANVKVEDFGAYNVLVRNKGGGSLAYQWSKAAQLTVSSPPEITHTTGSLSLIEGESIDLSVTALGTEPLVYQWNKDGEPVDGASSSTLPLAKVALSDAGDYTVVVSNIAGQVESGVVAVDIIQPAKIVMQPKGADVILGDSVSMAATVEGTEPISYSWYHDNELVESKTGNTLHLDRVKAEDAGGYHLVATNPGGTDKSQLVKLTVLLPPEITHTTGSLSVIERESAKLSVTAKGSGSLVYQWSKGGHDLENATSPTLRLANVAPAAAGEYTVTVSNTAGQAVSDAMTLTVIEPVRIMTQPVGVEVTFGDTVTLSVVAGGTEPISYYWLRNGEPIEGGTQRTLMLDDVQAWDTGEYIVIANNPGGKDTSKPATLSAGLPDGVYFMEDFDNLPLHPWVSPDESTGDGTDWTDESPADWAMAHGGNHEPTTTTEFDGWAFVDPLSWYKTAGSERDLFTKGNGVISVADSAHAAAGAKNTVFSALMATPTIDITGADSGSLVLTYDTGWQVEQGKRVLAAFEENFEGDDVSEEVSIAGTAAQGLEFVSTGGQWPWLKLNGILKVTEAVFAQSGGMLIDDFSEGATFNEFEINFRMFMGRGTSRPADGLSVSIGNNLPNLAKPAEEGVPDAAFRVCFDAWDSGGGEAPAIEIFNGKQSVAIQKFHGKSSASNDAKFVKDDGEFLMMWDNKKWADVNIRVTNGLANVKFRGYDVIKNVPIDLAPIEAAQFLFAARTGGANQRHYIDDVQIELLTSANSRVTVAYDDGEPVTLLELNSKTPTTHDETVSLALNNPVGAKSAVVTWDYQGYDNWWAIDNITIAEGDETESPRPGLATDRGRYLSGESVTVSFSDGPGNPKDWIGVYRRDITPGEQDSLAWVYVNGSTTPDVGVSDGTVTFASNLSVGSYVIRFFANDGYSQLSDAVTFSVVEPPAVATGKLNYVADEAITVNFSNGPGNPRDWISLVHRNETSYIDWAYVGGTRNPDDGLATGTLTFAHGLPDGEYRVLYHANDSNRQLATADFTVAGQVAPPALGFAHNGDSTITLSFEGRLQTAPTINGPWQDVDATSPVTLSTDQRQQFTRSVK